MGPCGGSHQTTKQPIAPHCTTLCPLALAWTAIAAAQSHGTQDTITRPVPHGCPAVHAAGYAHHSGSPGLTRTPALASKSAKGVPSSSPRV
jgi:hypothetical protein